MAGRHKNIRHWQQAAVGWRTLAADVVGKARKDVIDHVFQYGKAKDIPVAGDWNGDGVTTDLACSGTASGFSTRTATVSGARETSMPISANPAIFPWSATGRETA